MDWDLEGDAGIENDTDFDAACVANLLKAIRGEC
jgi:hypothetical protein